MSEKFPAIPDPQISPESHQTVLLALKEAVEMLTGRRGKIVATRERVLQESIAAQSFPSGTKMLFVQTAAPTGWTKDTTHNDRALRIVSGSAVASVGGVSFSAAFALRTPTGTVQNHTLTTAEMPQHRHTPPPGNYLKLNADNLLQYVQGGGSGNYIGWGGIGDMGLTGSSNAHGHGLVMNAMDFSVAYVDAIIATKD